MIGEPDDGRGRAQRMQGSSGVSHSSQPQTAVAQPSSGVSQEPSPSPVNAMSRTTRLRIRRPTASYAY
ncbi:MAG: hypothetical protein IPK83_19900 [Planctomycetes bacterium]|nr:hypothetical protein [Planctomycetota bacterium]